jgi:DNA-binding NarL/FixJ family response regulator
MCPINRSLLPAREGAPLGSFSNVESSHRRPLRVVLVEDSSVLRDRLTESLNTPGHVEIVAFADTEASALAALTSQDWDAVVLDLQLREGNGLGVLRGLKREGAATGTIIVLTNYAFPQYRAKSEQLGAHYFLDKSRDYRKLRDILYRLADG